MSQEFEVSNGENMIVGVDMAKGPVQTSVRQYNPNTGDYVDVAVDVTPMEDAPATELVGDSVVSREDEIVAETAVSADRAKELFNVQRALSSIEQIQEDIRVKRSSVITDEDLLAHVQNRVAETTVDHIKEMTAEEINGYFVDASGGVIEIDLNFEGSADREIEFKRDFMIFMRESIDAEKSINAEADKLKEELEKGDEEMKQLMSQYGSTSNYMRSQILFSIEHSTSDAQKERFQKILEAFDDAFDLTRVIENYNNQSLIHNTIGDMKHRAGAVYAKYMKTMKQLRIRGDVTVFNNLETKFLPEEYHAQPNMFIFAVIKFVAYRKITPENAAAEAMFVSQFTENVRNFFAKGFESEEKAEQFKKNIMTVLDLFI